MKKIIYLFLSTAFFVFVPAKTFHAGGLQVTPEKIDLIHNDLSPASAKLLIVNPTTNVQFFEVSADEFTEKIKINPESFTLEAGMRKEVIVSEQNLKKEKTGSVLTTNLSIISKPMSENKLNVGAGIKIPITIKIVSNSQTQDGQIHNALLYLIFGIVLIAMVLILKFKKAFLVKKF